jgi:putative phosphoesterase
MVSARKRFHLKSGRIGLISDTHGLVRPEAVAALKRSDLIIHAGDIGKPAVLAALQAVAPLVAIRGNNDRGAWARKIPDILDLNVDGFSIRVIHDVNDLDRAAAAGFHAVISGHSHKPGVITRDGKLPIAVGRLQFSTGKIRATILNLQV